MKSDDITVHVLKEIRDEVKGLRGEVDKTNVRLDKSEASLNGRIDQMRLEVTRAIADSEIRTATAITALGGTMTEVKDLLADRLDLSDRVGRCERDIEMLKAHVGR